MADNFTGEIDERLEDLFGDEVGFSDMGEEEELDDNPLRELKSIVLSIDWEITDEVMTKLIDQIAELKTTFKNDKIILMFLQLLGTIGEYIRTNKANAHPDSFKILNSLFTQMNKVVQDDSLTVPAKKKILAVELNKYKKLKSKLVPAKTDNIPKKQPKPPEEKRNVQETNQGNSEPNDLAAAVEEIKKLIRTEFKTLRAELKLLRERR